MLKYLKCCGKVMVSGALLSMSFMAANLHAQADDNDKMEEEMKKAGKTREIDGEEMDQEREKETFKDRLKKAREVPKMPRNEKGGGFVAGHAGVGQAYSAEPKSSPGFSILAGVEGGFIHQNSSFNRLEMGLMLFTGTAAFSDEDVKSNLPIGIGLMPRFGYGYALAPGMFGVLRVQAGMSQGRIDGKTKKGDVSFKTDPVWGFVVGAGWDMVFEASDNLEFLAGLSVTHFQYKFDTIKVDGQKVAGEDLVVNMNLPQIELGLRYKF